MKTITIILILLLFITSCEKDEDSESTRSCAVEPRLHDMGNGAILNLSQQVWYLRDLDGGGSVNLYIKGSIVGNRVTVRTYGDGEYSDKNISLNRNKEFEEDVVISFTAMSRPRGEFTDNTVIILYHGNSINLISLESCVLMY